MPRYAVLIALQINNWNEWRKDRETERSYIIELLENFQLNQEEYKDSQKRLVNIMKSMVVLLEQSALYNANLSIQNLNTHFKNIQDMPSYDETDRAYSNITGSGKLGILQNNYLSEALAKYYSKLKQILVVQNTHELELVETFQPYIIDYMDYQSVLSIRTTDAILPPPSQEEDRILIVLKDQKFRNVLTQKWIISNDFFNENNELETLRTEVIKHLKA